MNRHHAAHHHPPGPIAGLRLVRWHRLGLDTAGTLLAASGLVWLAVHYAIGAGAGDLPHPLEAWCLRLHGLAAFAGVFMLGVLAAAHVPHGWRLSQRRRWAGQRTSGLVLATLGGLLVASGYALYYFAPEGVRPALGWAHAGLGLAMAGGLLWHRRGHPQRHHQP